MTTDQGSGSMPENDHIPCQAEVIEAMNHLWQVNWDRCTQREDGGTAFGWIAREDGRSDFIVLHWGRGGFGFTTSSAALGRVFAKELFGTDAGHNDCQTIQSVFGDFIRNKVKR